MFVKLNILITLDEHEHYPLNSTITLALDSTDRLLETFELDSWLITDN